MRCRLTELVLRWHYSNQSPVTPTSTPREQIYPRDLRHYRLVRVVSPVASRSRRKPMEVPMRVVFGYGACVRDGAWWGHRTGELLLESVGPERGTAAAELRGGWAAGWRRQFGTARGRRGSPA
jgi:hypothetical protein